MVKQLSIGSAMVAAAALLVWAGSARAAPPPNGWVGHMEIPVVACDTAQDVKEIADAGNRGPEELNGTFMKYNGRVNAKNEPECVYGDLGMFAVTGSESLGTTKNAKGMPVNAWLVHAKNPNVEFFVLYVEKVVDEKDGSI